MNKIFVLCALGLLAISLVGCGQKEVPPAPETTNGEQPAANEPADADAEIDAQLQDDAEDVEFGEII